jgi:hypothetical protein
MNIITTEISSACGRGSRGIANLKVISQQQFLPFSFQSAFPHHTRFKHLICTIFSLNHLNRISRTQNNSYDLRITEAMTATTKSACKMNRIWAVALMTNQTRPLIIGDGHDKWP